MRRYKLRSIAYEIYYDGLMRIKLHPLFVLLALYFVLTNRAVMFGGYVLAIIAHEVAHSRAAEWRGYSLGTVTLMPYGGVIADGDNYDDKDGVIIALTAPVFNALCAISVVALWWLVPSSYGYTKDVCTANVALCIVNLIPVYPLDGYRAVVSLAKNKNRAVKIMKASGLAVGAALVVLGIVSVWYEFNPTIAVFGFFLIYEAVFGAGGERVVNASANNKFCKNYRAGVGKRTILIYKDAPLVRILTTVGRDTLSQFDVVDEAGKVLYTLDETDVGVMCEECELSSTVDEAYRKTFC